MTENDCTTKNTTGKPAHSGESAHNGKPPYNEKPARSEGPIHNGTPTHSDEPIHNGAPTHNQMPAHSEGPTHNQNPATEADALLNLQDTDFRLLQLNKKLDELPHRVKILESRAKIREVEEKLAHIAGLRVENDRMIRRFQDEESAAIAHRKGVQAKIEASSNYKEATALTRELETYGKKADAAAGETLKQWEKLERIDEVEAQASAVLARLKTQEAETVEDFKKQGGALKAAIAQETSLREFYAAQLPAALLNRYEKAVVAKGGIGAAWIEGDHCSACRMPYSEGTIFNLRSKGSLAECPHCHRLLATKATSDRKHSRKV